MCFNAGEAYDIPRPAPWVNEEVYDVPTHQQPQQQPTFPEDIYNVPSNLLSKSKSSDDIIYDVPPRVSRGPMQRSCEILNDRHNPVDDDDVYDVPVTRLQSAASRDMIDMCSQHDIYDVPNPSASATQDIYDVPSSLMSSDHDVYDVPNSLLSIDNNEVSRCGVYIQKV